MPGSEREGEEEHNGLQENLWASLKERRGLQGSSSTGELLSVSSNATLGNHEELLQPMCNRGHRVGLGGLDRFSAGSISSASLSSLSSMFSEYEDEERDEESRRKKKHKKVVRQFFTLEVLTNREARLMLLFFWAMVVIELLTAFLVVNLSSQSEVVQDGTAWTWNKTAAMWEYQFEVDWDIAYQLFTVDAEVYSTVTDELFTIENIIYAQDDDDHSDVYTYSFNSFTTWRGAGDTSAIEFVSIADTECAEHTCSTTPAAVSKFFIVIRVGPRVSNGIAFGEVYFRRYDKGWFYAITSMYLIIFVVAMTISVFLVGKALRAKKFADFSIQMKISILFGFGTILFILNPLPVIFLFFPSRWGLIYAYAVSVPLGACSMVFSLLALVDSLLYPIGATNLPFDKFYRWKLLFTGVLFIFLEALVVASIVIVPSFWKTGDVSYLDEESTARGRYIITAIFAGVLLVLLAMLVWVYIKIFKLKGRLKKYPYMVCRFRHLARKPLELAVYTFVVLMVIESLLPFVFSTDEVSEHFYAAMPVKNLWFLPSFAVFIVYVFLPAAVAGHAIENFNEKQTASEFCLGTARFMIDFASEAYRIGVEPEDNSDTNNEVLRPEVFGYSIVSVLQDKELDLCCMVAEKSNSLIVCFRGTASTRNMKTDLKMGWATMNNDEEEEEERFAFLKRMKNKRKVHKGFWKAYCRLRKDILRVVFSRWGPEMGQVLLTGHSLGGALSTLLAYELQSVHRIPVLMYVFGCPRVGNRPFAEAFDQLVPYCYRVCVDGDVITGLPAKFLGYKHVGHPVVVDNFGNLMVSPAGPLEGSLSSSRRKFKCHRMTFYRHCINAALKLDRRMGLLTYDGADLSGKPQQKYMFQKERCCIDFGIASVLPVTALTDAVICGPNIPKPPVEIPSLMFAIDNEDAGSNA
eukprot:Nk52_evm40s2531 gene=Nk52_evmTU40s2531